MRIGVLTLVLHTMDQVMDTTVQIEESLVNTKEGSVLDSQKRDSFWMGLPVLAMLYKLDPSHRTLHLHQ